MARPMRPSITVIRTLRTQRMRLPGKLAENVSTGTSPSPKERTQLRSNSNAEFVVIRPRLSAGLFSSAHPAERKGLCRYDGRPMVDWAKRTGLGREALINAARTAVAALVSLLLARSLLKLPEFYWAPISTIVILLSTINPMTLAWQRFAGTALGAALGALIATFFNPNWAVYGGGIFVCGILCSLLRVGSAYRFAAIALSIVLLVAHQRAAWIVATHRFVEVSLGIAVALVFTMAWRSPGVKPG